MTKLQSLVFDLYYKQSNTFESISKKLDINTYVALQKTITDKKSEALEKIK